MIILKVLPIIAVANAAIAISFGVFMVDIDQAEVAESPTLFLASPRDHELWVAITTCWALS